VHQPVDLARVAVGVADLLAGAVAEQVRGGHHPAALLGDQGHAVGDPGIDDELTRVTLELAHHRVDRHRHARHDRLDVRVDQCGELFTVAAAKGTDLDRGHANLHDRALRARNLEAATGAVHG
jgi:hypothetical protein